MNKYLPVFILTFFIFSCQSKKEKVVFEKPVASVEELINHSEEFNKPEIIKVTEGVHVAVGFVLANSILIEGAKGNIIVDCWQSKHDRVDSAGCYI